MNIKVSSLAIKEKEKEVMHHERDHNKSTRNNEKRALISHPPCKRAKKGTME